jgi:hypothetical protein
VHVHRAADNIGQHSARFPPPTLQNDPLIEFPRTLGQLLLLLLFLFLFLFLIAAPFLFLFLVLFLLLFLVLLLLVVLVSEY